MRSQTKTKVWPWTDEQGVPLSDSELKEVSKNWTIEDWKNFQKYGMRDKSRMGDLLDDARNIERKFSHVHNIWDLTAGETSSSLKGKIPTLRNGIKKLDEKSYQVLKLYYQDSMTDKQIARSMGENHRAIQARRIRAIKKLKQFFEEEEKLKSSQGKIQEKNNTRSSKIAP